MNFWKAFVKSELVGILASLVFGLCAGIATISGQPKPLMVFANNALETFLFLMAISLPLTALVCAASLCPFKYALLSIICGGVWLFAEISGYGFFMKQSFDVRDALQSAFLFSFVAIVSCTTLRIMASIETNRIQSTTATK